MTYTIFTFLFIDSERESYTLTLHGNNSAYDALENWVKSTKNSSLIPHNMTQLVRYVDAVEVHQFEVVTCQGEPIDSTLTKMSHHSILPGKYSDVQQQLAKIF